MRDKYDDAVDYLSEHPEEIRDAWEFADDCKIGEALFQFATPDGEASAERPQCGCLTSIRAGNGFSRTAWTEDLTRAIRADSRIPANVADIRPEHLPAFAEWQRRLDREIRMIGGTQS